MSKKYFLTFLLLGGFYIASAQIALPIFLEAISKPVIAQPTSVQIGIYVWSIKNLDVTTYRNGDPIPKVEDPTVWVNLNTGATNSTGFTAIGLGQRGPSGTFQSMFTEVYFGAANSTGHFDLNYSNNDVRYYPTSNSKWGMNIRLLKDYYV